MVGHLRHGNLYRPLGSIFGSDGCGEYLFPHDGSSIVGRPVNIRLTLSFLGFFEACVTPACTTYMARFYKQREQGARTGMSIHTMNANSRCLDVGQLVWNHHRS